MWVGMCSRGCILCQRLYPGVYCCLEPKYCFLNILFLVEKDIELVFMCAGCSQRPCACIQVVHPVHSGLVHAYGWSTRGTTLGLVHAYK